MCSKKRILYLCVNNSCRSQMAEAITKDKLDDKFKVYSAGSEPTKVNKHAITVLKEIGIDPDGQYSKSVDLYKDKKFDYVVTVCAEERCPIFLGDAKKRMHKTFDDPGAAEGTQEEILNEFRKVRDEIKDWILQKFSK